MQQAEREVEKRVREVAQYIDPNTWVALSTRNLGEVINSYD